MTPDVISNGKNIPVQAAIAARAPPNAKVPVSPINTEALCRILIHGYKPFFLLFTSLKKSSISPIVANAIVAAQAPETSIEEKPTNTSATTTPIVIVHPWPYADNGGKGTIRKGHRACFGVNDGASVFPRISIVSGNDWFLRRWWRQNRHDGGTGDEYRKGHESETQWRKMALWERERCTSGCRGGDWRRRKLRLVTGNESIQTAARLKMKMKTARLKKFHLDGFRLQESTASSKDDRNGFGFLVRCNQSMTVNKSSLLDPNFSDFSPEEEFGGMWHVHRHNSNFGRLHHRHPIAPTPVVSISADPTLLDLLLGHLINLLLGRLINLRNHLWSLFRKYLPSRPLFDELSTILPIVVVWMRIYERRVELPKTLLCYLMNLDDYNIRSIFFPGMPSNAVQPLFGFSSFGIIDFTDDHDLPVLKVHMKSLHTIEILRINYMDEMEDDSCEMV
ncbi:hypothetical protein Ccrd_020846 [Cynara cardunculus var. scolymus]|uniref:Uncharacterized protein n=1 Tax=Cynara cardunculus var. scolymus TaxID=59895 RepID=A0A103Y1P4_CYNCS|nr:hypothetical protein Ccrd_020846 [Cynara cardunculus var. scolymus]